MGASEGADQAISAMERLCGQVHIPSNLKKFGIRRADLTAMADDASKIDRLLKNNPVRLSVIPFCRFMKGHGQGGQCSVCSQKTEMVFFEHEKE